MTDDSRLRLIQLRGIFFRALGEAQFMHARLEEIWAAKPITPEEEKALRTAAAQQEEQWQQKFAEAEDLYAEILAIKPTDSGEIRDKVKVIRAWDVEEEGSEPPILTDTARALLEDVEHLAGMIHDLSKDKQAA